MTANKTLTTDQTQALETKVADKITMQGSVRYSLKRSGRTRPLVEGFSGDDLHQKTGRWMSKARIVDRERDQYLEEIVDRETGEVVHRCDEPLSEHRGHGSAKKR